MATILTFPKIDSSSDGTLSSWVAEDGASVSKGDLLYYVERGDTILEMVAPVAGRLNTTGVPGVVYPAGAVIGKID